jgi:hypothetical protein
MRRKSLAILAGLAGMALWPAHAQVRVDMNRITCRDFLSYDFEKRNFVGYWMSGYYSASRNNDLLDFRHLQRNAQRVLAYCKKHKAAPLPKAIKINAL